MDEVQEVKKSNTKSDGAGSENQEKSQETTKDDSSSALFEEFSNFSFDDVSSLNQGDKKDSEKPDTTKESESKQRPKSGFRLPSLSLDGSSDKPVERSEDPRTSTPTVDQLRSLPVVPGFDPSSLRIGEGRGPNFQFPRRMPNSAPQEYLRRNAPFSPQDARPFMQGLGQFLNNPEVQNRIGQVLNNPEVRRGITEVVNQVGSQVGVHVDSQRGEVNLNMDFDGLYEKSVPKDSPEYNPDTKEMLSHLQNVRLRTDSVELKFDSEQVMKLGDKGIAALYKLNIGADNGVTSLKYETTPTKLTMSEIKGMNVIDASGKELKLHALTLDSTDPKNPTGSVTIDNPLPRPEFLPKSVPWSDTVTVPLLLPQEQKQELAEKLPGTIKTIDAIVSGAKTGDLTQIIQKLDLNEATGMLGWGMRNKGNLDLNSAWRPPDMRQLLDGYQPRPIPGTRQQPIDGVRR